MVTGYTCGFVWLLIWNMKVHIYNVPLTVLQKNWLRINATTDLFLSKVVCWVRPCCFCLSRTFEMDHVVGWWYVLANHLLSFLYSSSLFQLRSVRSVGKYMVIEILVQCCIRQTKKHLKENKRYISVRASIWVYVCVSHPHGINLPNAIIQSVNVRKKIIQWVKKHLNSHLYILQSSTSELQMKSSGLNSSIEFGCFPQPHCQPEQFSFVQPSQIFNMTCVCLILFYISYLWNIIFMNKHSMPIENISTIADFNSTGFPLFRTDKIPWLFQVFQEISRCFFIILKVVLIYIHILTNFHCTKKLTISIILQINKPSLQPILVI